jgi:nucleotide-binding universal stress UspA family protein
LVTVVRDEAHTDARRVRLGHLAAGLVAKGAPTDTEVRVGEPAEQIVAAATDAGADLIAMATHGRAGLTRAFLGSVAERVLTASPIPVLMVRPGCHEMIGLRTILVPVDGSPGSALALASAVALARAATARLVLLQVIVPVLAYQTINTSWFGAAVTFDPAWDDEALVAGRAYVTGLAQRVQASGVEAEGIALIGESVTPSTSVVDAIVAQADTAGADLIAMSTHAHTGAARLVLGSVADALVRGSHRPVLLLRRGISASAAVGPADAAVSS